MGAQEDRAGPSQDSPARAGMWLPGAGQKWDSGEGAVGSARIPEGAAHPWASSDHKPLNPTYSLL